jgi:putative addiction module component (TIGR02574 family)
MSDTTQQLIATALELSPAERAVVANAILRSLGDFDGSPESQDAWNAELRKRIADVDSGRVKTIPSSEAWKMIDGEIELRD